MSNLTASDRHLLKSTAGDYGITLSNADCETADYQIRKNICNIHPDADADLIDALYYETAKNYFRN